MMRSSARRGFALARRPVLTLLALLGVASSGVAGQPPRFYWDPVPSGHWVITDPTLAIPPAAIMIFEKMELDDTRSDRDEAILTIRRRIRIVRDGGSGAAEIALPYHERAKEIVEIHARTLHRDGREFEVSLDDAVRGFVFRWDDDSVESRTVIMPGVSDGCIVDLFVQYLMKWPIRDWPAQKEIPLLQGELVWRPRTDFRRLMPCHFWMNPTSTCRVDTIPAPPGEDGEAIRFSVSRMAAIPDIPFTLAGTRNETALLFYYADPGYWGELTSMFRRVFEYIAEEAEDLKELTRGVERTEDRLQLARDVRENLLERVQIDDTLERSRHDSLMEDMERALKEGKGTEQEWTTLYWLALKDLDVPAYIAYVRDRRLGPVERAVRFWQFNHAIVNVELEDGGVVHVALGDALPFGDIPWYLQDASAFVVKGDVGHWETTTPSAASENARHLTVEWTVADDESIHGALRCEMTGEWARALRLRMEDLGVAGQTTVARDWLRREHPTAEIHNVGVEGAEDTEIPLILRADVVPVARLATMGDLRVLRPLAILERAQPRWVREEREHPCVLPYAYEKRSEATVHFPDDWVIDDVPRSRKLRNRAGECFVDASIEGTTLTLLREMRLTKATIEARHAGDLFDLLARQRESDDLAVVVRAPSRP